MHGYCGVVIVAVKPSHQAFRSVSLKGLYTCFCVLLTTAYFCGSPDNFSAVRIVVYFWPLTVAVHSDPGRGSTHTSHVWWLHVPCMGRRSRLAVCSLLHSAAAWHCSHEAHPAQRPLIQGMYTHLWHRRLLMRITHRSYVWYALAVSVHVIIAFSCKDNIIHCSASSFTDAVSKSHGRLVINSLSISALRCSLAGVSSYQVLHWYKYIIAFKNWWMLLQGWQGTRFKICMWHLPIIY